MVGYVGTHGTNPAVRKLPYDAVKDFTPIAMVGGTPNVLVVPPSVPAKTLQEFVAYVKANPGKLSYGSSGPGTLTHLAMEQLKVAADLDIVHVPYRGIGPAITDILGGQTQALFPGLAAALPHIKAGKMKPLAVTGTKRHPLLPDVPTFDELGLQGIRRRAVVRHRRPGQPAGRRSSSALNDEINKMLAESRSARAAVRRSAGADADDAGAVRPVHARRHRQVVEAREGPRHRDRRMMANDAPVAADLDAPPITRILADFVAAHPSRGWERRRRPRGAAHAS